MCAQPGSPDLSQTVISAPSEAVTASAAAALAAKAKPGDIILLEGDLGAGKTSFARAFIRTYIGQATAEVPSPTFNLLQIYDGSQGQVWHFDLYRLKEPEEIYELGWEDRDSRTLMLIEWPDKLEFLTPCNCLRVNLLAVPGHPEARTIIISDERDYP